MVYKTISSELGIYIDDSGQRYELLEATSVATPQGKNYGWTEYESLDKAIEGFNLKIITESTTAQSLQNQIDDIKEDNQMLTDCLLEISEIIYQ